MRTHALAGYFAAILVGWAAIGSAFADVTEIPNRGPQTGVKNYIGRPAYPRSIGAVEIPQNPHMSPNGTSNIHIDTYMSDTYTTGGPLGHRRKMEVTSTDIGAECGTVTFDGEGRVVAVCIGVNLPELYLFDPDTLETLATYDLPDRPIDSSGLGAGGYFYLDDQYRAIIPTADNQIYIVEETGSPVEWNLAFSCDLTTDDKITADTVINSALPDGNGLIWFVTTDGVVGTVAIDENAVVVENKCVIGTIQLTTGTVDETLSKSFSIDPDPSGGGVFIVTDYALYRFDTDDDNAPEIVWRSAYDRGTRVKPGQKSQGSGTTPTLIGTETGKKFVAITDNADPWEHVLVYDRSTGDLFCRQRLFLPFPYFNNTYNSLIAFTAEDKEKASIIVENNYGYRGTESTELGGTTIPGIERVDVDFNEQKCRTVWRNYEVSIPTVVSQLSLEDGLIYTYTKPRERRTRANPWYFTAIDFRSGRTIYQQLAGTGLGYNNNYSGVYLSPDGVGYVGVLAGLVRVGEQGSSIPSRRPFQWPIDFDWPFWLSGW